MSGDQQNKSNLAIWIPVIVAVIGLLGIVLKAMIETNSGDSTTPPDDPPTIPEDEVPSQQEHVVLTSVFDSTGAFATSLNKISGRLVITCTVDEEPPIVTTLAIPAHDQGPNDGTWGFQYDLGSDGAVIIPYHNEDSIVKVNCNFSATMISDSNRPPENGTIEFGEVNFSIQDGAITAVDTKEAVSTTFIRDRIHSHIKIKLHVASEHQPNGTEQNPSTVNDGRVLLYENHDFNENGWVIPVSHDLQTIGDNLGRGYDDAISSIEVIKGTWRFYQNPNYQGPYEEYREGDEVSLWGNETLDDKISSIKRVK